MSDDSPNLSEDPSCSPGRHYVSDVEVEMSTDGAWVSHRLQQVFLL